MVIRSISSTRDFNPTRPVSREATSEIYTAQPADTESVKSAKEGIERYLDCIKGLHHKAKNITVYVSEDPHDKIDLLVDIDGKITATELKTLEASSLTRKYSSSQLVENTKVEAFLEMEDKGYGSELWRFYQDNVGVIDINKQTLSEHVVIDNPDELEDNDPDVKKMIDEAVMRGTIVRCHNWWCSYTTRGYGSGKVKKDIWFIPNQEVYWYKDREDVEMEKYYQYLEEKERLFSIIEKRKALNIL